MYIELIIIFNIYIDFLIIMMTSILMHQKISIKKIFSASFIYGLSSIVLFAKISILELLIFSFIMCFIITKIIFHKLKALMYFYLNAILIGGVIFLINNYFKISTFGNYLLLIILTPIILLIYKYRIKDLKENYNLNYQIHFKYNNQNIILNAFLDTGNKLNDPYFNKPVILINESIIKCDKYFYIPYSTITETGIIKATTVSEIEIVGIKKIKNAVIGLLPKKLQMKKIDCLLNNRLLEE